MPSSSILHVTSLHRYINIAVNANQSLFNSFYDHETQLRRSFYLRAHHQLKKYFEVQVEHKTKKQPDHQQTFDEVVREEKIHFEADGNSGKWETDFSDSLVSVVQVFTNFTLHIGNNAKQLLIYVNCDGMLKHAY
ncbi:uncharacterized protein V6R79_004526 [Siganus canaliculatus]